MDKLAIKFKKSLTRVGYKVVGWNGQYAFSLFNTKIQIPIIIGSEIIDSKGLFLGTSRQFCIEYYSGLSNYEDLLLTYEYNMTDIIQGNPNDKDGEVVVSKAILKNVEKLS